MVKACQICPYFLLLCAVVFSARAANVDIANLSTAVLAQRVGTGDVVTVVTIWRGTSSTLPHSINWTGKFYLSLDESIDSSDTVVETSNKAWWFERENSIALNNSFDITIPPVSFGEYYIISVEDPDNFVAETNESNNISVSAPLQILPHDVTLLNASIGPANASGNRMVAARVASPSSVPLWASVTLANSSWRGELHLGTNLVKFDAYVPDAITNLTARLALEAHEENVEDNVVQAEFYTHYNAELSIPSFLTGPSGGTPPFTWSIENKGTNEIWSPLGVELRFYTNSSDYVNPWTGVIWASDLFRISPEGLITHDWSFRIPAVPTGNYRAQMILLSLDGIPDVDPSDNQRWFDVHVRNPDLAINAPPSTNFIAGGEHQETLVVTNKGQGYWQDQDFARYSVRLSTPAGRQLDVYAQSSWLLNSQNIPPGGTNLLYLSYLLPIVPEGDYILTFSYLPRYGVDENPADNILTRQIFVKGGNVQVSLTVEPGNPSSEETIRATWTAQNLGSIPSAPFQLLFFLAADSPDPLPNWIYPGNRVPVRSVEIASPIQPRGIASGTINLPVRLPREGTNYFVAVDTRYPYLGILGVDEFFSTTSIPIHIRMPDLTIRDIRFSQITSNQVETVVMIVNVGDADFVHHTSGIASLSPVSIGAQHFTTTNNIPISGHLLVTNLITMENPYSTILQTSASIQVSRSAYDGDFWGWTTLERSTENNSSSGTLTVSYPDLIQIKLNLLQWDPSPGWTLEQTDNLTDPNWVESPLNNTNGNTFFAPTNRNLFYRLRRSP